MGMFSRRSRRSTKPEEETPDIPVPWRRLFGYLRPYGGYMVIALFGLIGNSLLSLVFPAMIQRVVDSVLVANDLALLDQITLILIGVFILRAFTQMIETFTINYVGERIIMDLRADLYQHMIAMSLAFFTKRRSGELLSRLSSDVTMIRQVLTDNITVLLQQLLLAIGSVAIMLALNWRLTLFILILVPVMAAIALVLGRQLRTASTRIQDEIAKATTVASEVIQNVREVKTFVREPYEKVRYTDAIREAFKVALQALRLRAALGSTIAFVAFAGLALVLWFGGREAIAGRLTGGELIAFLVYGLTVAGSLGSLLNLYSVFQQGIGATKRVFDILQQPPDILDAPNAQTLNRVNGEIRFQNVAFSYDQRQEVLHNLDLTIPAGEILALGRAERRGEKHHVQPDPALLRPHERQYHHRRDGLALGDAGQFAPANRHCAAGKPAVRRHNLREHPLWSVGSDRGGGLRGGASGQRARLHLGTAGPISDYRWRTRHPPERRAASARLHCARLAQRPACAAAR